MSSKNLVLLDNRKEDPNKSRRVEFRYILLNDAKINFIKKNFQ